MRLTNRFGTLSSTGFSALKGMFCQPRAMPWELGWGVLISSVALGFTHTIRHTATVHENGPGAGDEHGHPTAHE